MSAFDRGARWIALVCGAAASTCTPDRPSAGAADAAPLGAPTPPAVSSPAAQASNAPAASALPRASASTPSRVESRTFASAALGVSKRYEVYLPAGYDGARRFPVVYLLHGLGGTESNWLTHGALRQAADGLALEAIVVMPDGDAGFWINGTPSRSYDACMSERPPFSPAEPPASFCVKKASYEDYLTRDLVAEIDARYRTLTDRRSRGIGGLSMGGFGAMYLASRHLDLFSAAASHSGLLALRYVAPHPYRAGAAQLADTPGAWGAKYPEPVREHVRKLFGPTMAFWREHDPSALLAALAPGALALYIDCGTMDGFGFADHARYVHDLLTERGIEHTFVLAPGEHHFDFWKARLPESLRFFARTLTR